MFDSSLRTASVLHSETALIQTAAKLISKSSFLELHDTELYLTKYI